MRFTHSAGTATAAAAVLLLALGRPLVGQSVGDRVRVTAAGHTASGPIAEVGESTFKVLVPQGWHWEVGRDEVDRLEVSTGSRRSTVSGLGIGVGAGLVVSVVRIAARREFTCNHGGDFRHAIYCNVVLRPRYDHPPSKSEILTTSTVVLGVVGLLVGSWVERDTWQTVARDGPGTLALDPVADVGSVPAGGPAMTLGARIRF